MALYCPNCGFDNRDTARFCKQCGASLAGAAAPAPQPLPMPAQPWSPAPLQPAPQAMFPQASGAPAWLTASNGQRYPLSAYTTIGRGSTCDIILPDSNVSTQHATITESSGQWQIADDNSRNGTFVNRMKIAAPCPLHDGDEVILGGTALRFETGGGGTTLLDPAQMASLTTGAPPVSMPAPIQRGLSAPQACGKIMSAPNERQDQPPTDWTRVMISVTVTLGFLGALLTFIVFAISASIILICLGGAVLLPILFLLWMPAQMIFGAITGALKDDKPVTVVNFQIQDQISSYPIDVTFVRKRGTGGGIVQGDVVEVWGKQHGGAAITATKIRVIERQGHSTSAYIPIRNPWPWWIGLLVSGLAVAATLYVCSGLANLR